MNREDGEGDRDRKPIIPVQCGKCCEDSTQCMGEDGEERQN